MNRREILVIRTVMVLVVGNLAHLVKLTFLLADSSKQNLRRNVPARRRGMAQSVERRLRSAPLRILSLNLKLQSLLILKNLSKFETVYPRLICLICGRLDLAPL